LVYDHDEWAKHRKNARNVFNVAKSYRWSTLLRSIMLPVFLTASFAAVICTYNHAVAQGILSKAFPLLTIP